MVDNDPVEINEVGPRSASLTIDPDELQALIGSLLETHYHLDDNVAFSARVGVPRDFARALWVQLRDLQKRLP
jgi:hypothetical protein